MPARKKSKRKVPYEKGVPAKYLKNKKKPKSKVAAEIKRTAKLYKAGKLTPAMMKAISKKRSKG